LKLLMFYAPSFWFKTFEKVLDGAPEQERDETFEKAVVVFYQVEAEDEARRGKVLTKAVKNIKWIAGKFASRTVVLHSFNHLSASKADPGFAEPFMEEVRQRLENSGFTVGGTPFGYLNEWKLHVAGESLAKVFKEI
jgi:hypothetical protein